jgi:hypothetical protein
VQLWNERCTASGRRDANGDLPIHAILRDSKHVSLRAVDLLMSFWPTFRSPAAAAAAATSMDGVVDVDAGMEDEDVVLGVWASYHSTWLPMRMPAWMFCFICSNIIRVHCLSTRHLDDSIFRRLKSRYKEDASTRDR